MEKYYNEPKARVAKVRDAMSIVDPQIERVSKALMDMQDIESSGTGSRSVNDNLMHFQEVIADAFEAIEEARREMAVYLVLERGISREKVAKTSRVTGMTVGRWVKALVEE